MTEWLVMWGAVSFDYYRRMFGAALRGARFIPAYRGSVTP